jgi:hypothetical protein
MVSTSAASTTAASGAATVNANDGIGAIAGRIHDASATPATPPQTTNASVPGADFSAFQGKRRPAELADDDLRSAFSACCAVKYRPTNVAAPSPKARIPHAAAAMSSRDWKVRISSNTESG